MRELWWFFLGRLRIRLTGADPEGTLRLLARECPVGNIVSISPLEVEFDLGRGEWTQVEPLVKKRGDKAQVVGSRGLPVMAGKLVRYPLILITALLLLAATVWIPTRIFFIEVEGNGTLSRREILEKAGDCGLYFGCVRGEVRSEQIKNRLLESMPELSWVGVNTSGCVATITVRQRQTEPETAQTAAGNIIAVADAIITDQVVTRGTALHAPGDAVKAGQILISGYTDLGLCTHVEPAQGEVYGQTRRENTAVLPVKTLIPEGEGVEIKKYSVIFGKNRINFYADSGILYPGCGKMTQIRVLQLPGGFTLPVALVVETYTVASQTETERLPGQAEQTLTAQSRGMLLSGMIAGQILGEEAAFARQEGVYSLRTVYTCREMIGRYSIGILTEGDGNNDRENGERGAG